MRRTAENIINNARVAITRLPAPRYAPSPGDEAEAYEALRRAAVMLGWDDGERGPLGGVIAQGARVLIKPNFVLHANQGDGGIEPLITHPSLVRATVRAALEAGAARVAVGDAPVQGCDFDHLLAETGLGEWSRRMVETEPRFAGVFDFRRTSCVFVDGVRIASEGLLSEDRFALFDLADESLLEPVTDDRASFRVTCYDPSLMARTHAPGRHQYLVAKDVLDADVVINLPKLKTHKKAGVTCALKNLIGINGNKEFLPHHRVGGAARGGDCYPGDSLVKRAMEYALDRQNGSRSPLSTKLWHDAAENLSRIAVRAGDQLGVEGSWSGNDTVWRTGLDLNRILLYGRSDATMSDTPQRTVLHVVDAVVAGQGDGPLRPDPLALGLMLAGSSAAATDHVGALLLGYDPSRVAIVREAFGRFSWPLASFTSADVTIAGDLGEGRADELLPACGLPAVKYPAGWRDAAREFIAQARATGANRGL
ncbi:MAG TPA: DUF362 domain-containing protein [Blastocatellia bacterium]|nr:DUF362 domain-containing protein [Blastocatellia bacterium]